MAEAELALTLETLCLVMVVVEPLTLDTLATLPGLAVTSRTLGLALVRSSPLPDLPPATSPCESELPSPASL